MTTYPIDGSPLNIAVESPGHVWYTLPDQNAIGSLIVDPSGSYATERYEMAQPDSHPYDIAYANGMVWFTERNADKIGSIDVATGKLSEFPIHKPIVPPFGALTVFLPMIPNGSADDEQGFSSQPTGIDIAPDGRIWFLESAARKLAVFDPATGEFIEYPIPSYIVDSRLENIEVASSQRLWFTMPEANRLVSYDVTRDQFSAANTISPTGVFTLPTGLAIDSNGAAWVTARGSDVIGRHTPETLADFRWISVPTRNSAPANLVFDDLGSIWSLFFTEAASGSVGRFLIRASDTKLLGVSERSISAANSAPWGIDIDGDSNVWIADPGANLIAVWHPPYERHMYLAYIRGQ